MFVMGERGRTGPKLPPGEMREAVRLLLDEGLAQNKVAQQLGVTKSTVAFHARRLDLAPDPRFGRRYDWKAIRAAYDSGLSFRDCRARFGFSSDAWFDAVQRGDIVPRPRMMPIEDLLVVGRRTSRHHLKLRLLGDGLKTNCCEECGIDEWRGRPLSMALHHVNGDGTDNRFDNLRFLCPNCHAQTPNYGGRNGHRRNRSENGVARRPRG
jgi:hypothetical protein